VTSEQTELVERVLDRTADAAALNRLLELLGSDPSFRQDFAETMRLHGLLHGAMGPDSSCEHLADVVSVAIPSNGRALESRVMAQIREQGIEPAQPQTRRFRRIGAVAAAAALLLAGGIAILMRESPGVTLVTSGGDVAIDRGGQRVAAASSLPLQGGDTVTVPAAGWAWVRYADGTTLQIDADSALTLEEHRIGDAKRVRILKGVVFVDVAHQPSDRPMLLLTPHSQTKVLGTSFSLAVGKESTKLLVREGKVAFSKADAAIEVHGGQAATASPSAPLVAEPIRGELLRRLGKDHFMLGVMSGWAEKWVEETRAQGCRWDLRYQHLGGNWTQWNANGEFVTMYLEESAKLGVVPVFTYYGMLKSSPAKLEPGAVAAEIQKNCRDSKTMRRYFEDLRLLMQKAGAHKKPVILHVEPGVWARFLTAPEFNPNALDRVPVMVRSSGVAELEGLDDTAASFGKAFGVLRDRFAPNVLLAWHVSKVDGLTPEVAAEALLRCGAWELLFTDVGDRDSGYKEARGSTDAWWKDADFLAFRDWGKQVYARTGLPLMIWRIPLGNTHMAACNNTPWHFMDNRAEYWLEKYPTNRHIAEWADAGFVGLLFGGGTVECTVHKDNAKDGVTNPPPVAGNKGETSDFTDDDGGYLRLRAGAYYQSGPYPFPGK
jgi:ferric-dicitrate binding protein FerR (iron transport regulator)